MKNSHNKSILLRCIICGGTNFEFNDDKSWIKCKQCGKEYPEGYDELEKLNQGLINQELDKTKRSEEHTSELQSHSFISYAVFCLKKKKKKATKKHKKT